MTTEVVTATTDTSLPQLVDLMVRCDVTGLPVVDDDGRVLGVVTEADLVAREAYPHSRRPRLTALDELRGRRNRWWQKASGITVGEIMTVPAHTASPSEPIRLAASSMLTLGVKRLPVVDRDGRLVGIVSRRDLLRALHRTDEAIALDVRTTLANPLQMPSEHGVTLTCVAGGIAFLSGWTHTARDAEAIEAVVREIPGVIDTRAGIGYRAPARAEDPWHRTETPAR